MQSTESVTPPILRLEGLRHRLVDKAKCEHFTVYVERCLEFMSQDFIGLLGPSGCGKTTLLTVLGLLRSPADLQDLKTFELNVPDENSADAWHNIDVRQAWQKRQFRLIDKLRRQHFGFALQSGELVSSLTVRENIAMPLHLNGWKRPAIDKRVHQLLQQFRLNRIRGEQVHDDALDGQLAGSPTSPEPAGNKPNALANSRVNRLSGGEYQRVTLARAISHRPSVVFVDEPTSALNRELAHDALSELRELQCNRARAGITFMITHDEELAREFCNVIVRMAPRRNEPAGEVVEVVRLSELEPDVAEPSRVHAVGE